MTLIFCELIFWLTHEACIVWAVKRTQLQMYTILRQGKPVGSPKLVGTSTCRQFWRANTETTYQHLQKFLSVRYKTYCKFTCCLL